MQWLGADKQSQVKSMAKLLVKQQVYTSFSFTGFEPFNT
jgi:hypothetical protein